MSRTLWSLVYASRSFGNAVFFTGSGILGVELPFERPDDLDGALFGLLGEGGRLAKALLVGVIGVLDGRSMGKVLNEATGERGCSPVRGRGGNGGLPDALLLPTGPVGTDCSVKSGVLSSSSIEGNAWLKPLKSKLLLNALFGGEDDGVDEGEGGPRLDGETKARCELLADEEFTGVIAEGAGNGWYCGVAWLRGETGGVGSSRTVFV